MSCDNVRELVPRLVDQELDTEQRETVIRHVASCRTCGARLESLGEVRAAMGRMRDVKVPPQLSAQLSVLASKERVRTLNRLTMADRVENLLGRVRLMADNLMRPVALPFAGGVFSAFLLFSALVPTLAMQRPIGTDVPISLFTDPSLEDIGHSHFNIDETVMLLTVDDRGRVSDVTIPNGTLTPELANDLIFYRFAPATSFGQPTWGKVTVTFRRSGGGNHIVVRG